MTRSRRNSCVRRVIRGLAIRGRVTRLLLGIASVLTAILSMGTGLSAQTLTVGEVTAYPTETGVAVPVLVSSEDALSGVDIALTYASSRLTLTEIEFANGVLGGGGYEILEIDTTIAGELTVEIEFDSIAPYDDALPSGDDQLLFELIFDVDNFQFPGTVSDIEFETGLFAPFPSQVFVDGIADSTTRVDGAVVITDENHLILPSFTVRPGDSHELAIRAFNVETVHGYQVAFSFDPDHAQVVESISLEGTIAESVGAEFVIATVDNIAGTAIFGVLLDFEPPFDDQSISASGITHDFGYFDIDILEGAIGADAVLLTLEDGLGSPPIDNSFVTSGSGSASPVLVSGRLNLLNPIQFVRMDALTDGQINFGDVIAMLQFIFLNAPPPECTKTCDANDTGTVNLSDPLFTLAYLFQGGAEPPMPFPDAGLDPTPDNLNCMETE